MTYKLRLDPTVHEIYRTLPDPARADFALLLLDALADPLAHSTPYGHDDGVFRTIARGTVTAAILIGDDTLTVIQITHLG
ncbi:hypothetical protein ABZ547_08315 [Streptomyces sparsogenes]|uniref:hypothetical protein n=1 Tax=Streptomyces sparsogenes TaxID=67365 RepID=UPI0033EF5B37